MVPVRDKSKPDPSLIPALGAFPLLAPGTALKPSENGHLSWGHLFPSSLPNLVTCEETLLPSPPSLILAVTGWVSRGQLLCLCSASTQVPTPASVDGKHTPYLL